MKKFKFCIYRNGKELFSTIIECNDALEANLSYQEILKESNYVKKAFDMIKTTVINN